MTCVQCGEQTNNPRFCSRSCAASYNNVRFPKRERITRYCESCECDITNLAKYRRKLCNDCFGRVDGSMTLSLLQERAGYQRNARIRQKARAAYRKSDRPKQCVVCDYSKHYEVCHIKGINEFPPSTKIATVNDISNLIALCPNHHWELDNDDLVLPSRFAREAKA